MPSTLQTLGIDRVSVVPRITLVQELWNSTAAEAEQLPLTEARRQEIDRRLAAHRSPPPVAIPWEQAEAEALARHR